MKQLTKKAGGSAYRLYYVQNSAIQTVRRILTRLEQRGMSGDDMGEAADSLTQVLDSLLPVKDGFELRKVRA